MFRWFPKDAVESRKAKVLDLILYSREQLVKEYDDMPEKGPSTSLPNVPWGIISIKPQVGLACNVDKPTFKHAWQQYNAKQVLFQ